MFCNHGTCFVIQQKHTFGGLCFCNVVCVQCLVDLGAWRTGARHARCVIPTRFSFAEYCEMVRRGRTVLLQGGAHQHVDSSFQERLGQVRCAIVHMPYDSQLFQFMSVASDRLSPFLHLFPPVRPPVRSPVRSPVRPSARSSVRPSRYSKNYSF